MKVDELKPLPPKRVRFTLAAQKTVPVASGCYVLAAFDGTVLYVGLATSLKIRFFQHRESKEKCSPTPDGKAFWFYFYECPLKEINMVERSWQQQHVVFHGRLPALNKCESPMS